MSFTATTLQAFLHRKIPLTKAMAVSVARLDSTGIELAGPLAANHNDKGTAFGGSLGTIMTLSGWSLVTASLRAMAIDAEVMIQDQVFSYRQPVTKDFNAHCQLPDPAQWDRFVATLRRRGKARVKLTAWIGAADKPAATMQGRYAAAMRN